ncbi:DinB family protein [bacterium SCSIO 12643]|nr:DinB family protein [bacterium SCSIO 12643]
MVKIKVIRKIERLINQSADYINKYSEDELSLKLNPKKWSKKEILGHLVDSGINNLQRFTEIQFEEKPYQLKSYRQDELVQANNYQGAETKDILDLLIAINKRIIDVVRLQTDETLNYEIITSNNKKLDLKYLIEDYVKHFEHHTKQIIDQT